MKKYRVKPFVNDADLDIMYKPQKRVFIFFWSALGSWSFENGILKKRWLSFRTYQECSNYLDKMMA